MALSNFSRMRAPGGGRDAPLQILLEEVLAQLGDPRPAPPPPGDPGQTFFWAVLETPFGQMLLSELDGHLASLNFLDALDHGRGLSRLRERWPLARFSPSASGLLLFQPLLVAVMGGEVPRYHPRLWTPESALPRPEPDPSLVEAQGAQP